MSLMEEKIIKSVEIEWITRNWGNTPCNVLGVRCTTRVFLIWRVWAHASAIPQLSYPSLELFQAMGIVENNQVVISLIKTFVPRVRQ